MGEALFGTLTLISPFISVFILLFAGQFVERIGKHHSMTFGLVMLVGASLSLSFARTPMHFGFVSALYGIGYGAVELSVNSVTMDWERERNITVMNKVHAAFCVGAVFSSLITGQLLGMGLTYQTILHIVVAIGAVTRRLNDRETVWVPSLTLTFTVLVAATPGVGTIRRRRVSGVGPGST
jgi:MFS family permease